MKRLVNRLDHNLERMLGNNLLFFDGAIGSVLQSKGLRAGERAELWNVTHKHDLIMLHLDYYLAGANIINTNTFGALSTNFKFMNYKTKMELYNLKDFSLESVITNGLKNALAARAGYYTKCNQNDKSPHKSFIAFDIGPTGKLLKPMGDLDFEEAINIYKTTFRIALDYMIKKEEQSIHAFMIETMSDCYEAKAAVIAAKEAEEEFKAHIPIFVSCVFDKTGHLLTGSDVKSVVAMLEGLGVSALGINCSLSPIEMKETIKEILENANIPVIVKPNAGLPEIVNGETVYSVTADEFATSMKEIAYMGASVIGGCCGTNPKYIEKIVKSVKEDNAYSTYFDRDLAFKNKISVKNKTVVSSYTHIVEIGGGNAPVLIGERINPTGKKLVKEALRSGNLNYIVHEALKQKDAGAAILDVNVGLPDIKEKPCMIKTIEVLQSVVDTPLQIDTTDIETMEAALRIYNGKALVNSVNAKEKVMEKVFPLVKKYGGVVVALTIDEEGIPATSAKRIELAKKIYRRAEHYGIKKADVLIDTLTMAVSASPGAAGQTLEAIKLLSTKYQAKTILGVSNISFGLPLRDEVTASFFTQALTAGLSCAIVNPLSSTLITAYKTYCLLNGYDENCLNYIEYANKLKEERDIIVAKCLNNSSTNVSKKEVSSKSNYSPLQEALIHGLVVDTQNETRALLDKGESPLTIIDKHLIPALDIVGKGFEEKKIYLPQLLLSADCAKASFDIIKTYLVKTDKKEKTRGSIILATVEGDIHDIGKNIVRTLLENYNFQVIDLGKDVPPSVIVKEAMDKNIKLVGLSALMTSTVPAMKETIKQLRAASSSIRVCVGGAVLNAIYAESIGADFYAKDAMAVVECAKKVFTE